MYEVIFTDFRIDSFGMLDVSCFMDILWLEMIKYSKIKI